MKKIELLILILLFANIASNSQSPCLPEGITFTTQEQIDNFQTNYPGCLEIEGNVTITGADITNLNGLSVLVSIEGNLVIRSNDILSELTGLQNLEYLGGDLRIEQNNVLVNLQGLENLVNLNGDLVIGDIELGQYPYSTGNPSLTSLTGLTNLVSIQGSLKLCGNYSLTTLSGLENLSFIGGSLQVGGIEFVYGFTFGNPLLVNLNGLTRLSAIGGGLFVAGNSNLTNLSGLDSLSSIGWNCWFDLNESLLTLQGLNRLASIGGSLYIRWNIALSDISALGNIAAQSIQDLEIIYNRALDKCSIQSICGYLANPGGSVTIEENAPGCNSPKEVAAACGLIGIEEMSHSNGFSIYPNPSMLQITIETACIPVKLSILDLSGRLIVYRKVTEPKTEIDISTLSRGVYFVRVQDNKGVQVEKFVKQ